MHVRAATVLLGLIVGWSSLPAPVSAHSQPPEIALWGPFLPGTVRCLRVLRKSTHDCFHAVVSVERDCIEQAMRGDTCDTSARDARITAITSRITAIATQTCKPGQITELGLNDPDPTGQFAHYCTQRAAATISLLYGPVVNATSPTVTDGGVRACLTQTGDVGQRAVEWMAALKADTLDPFTLRLVLPREKYQQLDNLSANISRIGQIVATRLQDRCPDFSTVYGQTPAQLVKTLEVRADCLLTATHNQNAIQCPPVCGNGIIEIGESCDDGNRVDSDGCRNDCTLP